MSVLKRKHSLTSLAMAALVFQAFVLACHFHDEDLNAALEHASCSAEFSAHGNQGCPSHDDNDECGLCWAVVATGATTLGTQTAIAAPAFEDRMILTQCGVTKAPQIACAAFQPRGPPVSLSS